ncbi:anti-repressor SinI family protein [Domibacillus sp.]|uniref:anti-repressor SinI family protein n=1 Tax=Domibacillus sp. TaxID=1969783 RepID=UPI002811A061|nr:anti-repressor SinI family protein [Domibacillus sp.]
MERKANIDWEWVELMKEAKNIGLKIGEVRLFLLSQSTKGVVSMQQKIVNNFQSF